MDTLVHTPKLLEQRLANDPEFFCEVIRAEFRSNKQDEPAKEPTEQQKKNIASRAYKLLHNWRTPPGSQKDGAYNGEPLTIWLEKIKEIRDDQDIWK